MTTKAVRRDVALALAALLLVQACGGGSDAAPSGPTAPTTPTTPAVTVASVRLSAEVASLTIGGSVTLTATPVDASGTTVAGKTVAWTTDNSAAATVDNGVVTGRGAGVARVTATVDGRSASAAITVTDPSTARIVVVGGNQQRGLIGRAHADSLTVRATSVSGTALANVAVRWTSTGGALSAATTTTDASGTARVQWTAAAGDHSVTASLDGALAAAITGNGRAGASCPLVRPAANRMSLGPTDPSLSLITSNIRALVLYVDFPGLAATEDPSVAMGTILNPGAEMLREMSYGRLTVTYTQVARWLRMSQPIGSYTWRTYQGHKAYLEEAMRLVDAEVDFRQFDAVYVVAPPSNGAQPISPTFNGGQSAGITLDGKTIGNAVTFGDDARRNGPAVMAHETGHMLGLVDLYTYDPAATPGIYQGNQFPFVGAWSLMSDIFRPAHLLAWEKYKLGWLDPSQVDCLDAAGGEEVIVQPNATAGGVKLVVFPVSPSKAIALEVRAATGADAGICAPGVLIYDVDAASGSGMAPGPALIRPSRPPSASGTMFTRCGPYADATYGVGAGAVSTFVDPSGVRVDVLSAEAGGAYRIRVKRP